jgi:hypothetical protein
VSAPKTGQKRSLCGIDHPTVPRVVFISREHNEQGPTLEGDTMAMLTERPASGIFLQTRRKRRGLTQARLGDAVHLNADTIRAYERGKRRIQEIWLPDLARELGLSPEDVREWQGLLQRDVARFWPRRGQAAMHAGMVASVR